MDEIAAWELLHKGVLRWIYDKGWKSLRDIQEEAVRPILSADRDIVISASTAAGKTEAAFLPAISKIADSTANGLGILYISPLKALINDQFRRLESLAESVDLPVTPWHGDVRQSVKKSLMNTPKGILLITPESLESLLLNHSSWCQNAFAPLSHIIIDEMHAFIGSERGVQLLSLMHRIEVMQKRIIPRIALSATLGDVALVAEFLRPHRTNFPCKIIESNTSGKELLLQLRGYVSDDDENSENEDDKQSDYKTMSLAEDIYNVSRGKFNLIFTNSRRNTEGFSAKLTELCNLNSVPNEFFPHHGSLSSELREYVESRLLENRVPTSAVCTMTLELGIDIGNVDAIAQVTAPHSVASLRQRLGRSGRRGEPAKLRVFIPEEKIHEDSSASDQLRIQTFQTVAVLNLLFKKWFEPPEKHQFHFSTLIQQTLSVIGQYGAIRADQLWNLLCSKGPFSLVNQDHYAQLLRSMGANQLITQMQDGLLTIGVEGEKLVESYRFYTAFQSQEEYRLRHDGREIGMVPLTQPLVVGSFVTFSGRYWEVTSVDPEGKVIELKVGPSGNPPRFEGQGISVHDSIRQEMRRIYIEKDRPAYLNETGRQLFNEGLEYFERFNLAKSYLVEGPARLEILPWLGDRVINTISILLKGADFRFWSFGGIITVAQCSADDFLSLARRLLDNPRPSNEDLVSQVTDTLIEKHDQYVPENLRRLAYGHRHFDVDTTWEWLKLLVYGDKGATP